jgi:hypothetical protein
VTLGDLACERRLLWFFCRSCSYEREIAPRSLGLSDDQVVPTAGQRHKCSRCGSKDIETRPQLHPEPLEVICARYRGASGQ